MSLDRGLCKFGAPNIHFRRKTTQKGIFFMPLLKIVCGSTIRFEDQTGFEPNLSISFPLKE